MTRLFKCWPPNRISGIGEARHFKCCVLIDVGSTSSCIIDYPGKGCVQGHVASLNFKK